jgi:beta-fructofuranosidase
MRDPWVWREKDGWYLAIGSGLKGGKGPVIPLYRSSDLVHWEYLHPLYEGDAELGDGTFCECPTFFPLDDLYVLALSHQATWLVGEYKNHKFIPKARGRFDCGRFYVPQVARDDKGRTILWGWITETRDREALMRAGWASMMTIPRLVSLTKDGRLAFEAAPELASIRTDPWGLQDLRLHDGTTTVWDGPRGASAELLMTYEPGSSGSVGVVFLDGCDRTEIRYDAATRTLRCGASSSTVLRSSHTSVELRIFLDGTTIELIADGTVCLTERFYPSCPEALQVGFFVRGGEAVITKAQWWRMDPALTDAMGR